LWKKPSRKNCLAEANIQPNILKTVSKATHIKGTLSGHHNVGKVFAEFCGGTAQELCKPHHHIEIRGVSGRNAELSTKISTVVCKS
jgi:hypothetical protein